MKFPLKDRPFERVALSPAMYLELERMIDAVLDATVEEYHEFVQRQNRMLSPNKWKPIKKRENVTVYKELSAREDRVLGPLGVRNETLALATLTLPKLLAVGTVNGNMHDMMLGLALHDAAAALVKSSYVDDALVDCAVLHEMRTATLEDPFRYVALKWLAKGHPAGLGSVVAPRDMVVVQSSGLIKGTTLGYHILQSVDLPECPSLEAKYGILRSRISTAFIFRQQAQDVVEVYVANYVEPNGTAPESVGVLSSAKSMNGSWKAITCAHNMKLSWILKNKDRYMCAAKHESTPTDDKCELCFHKATLTGKMDDCALCDARVCSRCRVTKKLSHVNRRLELNTTKHEFCKTCLYRVVNEDSKRIAAEMYTGEPIAPWRNTDGSVNDGFRFDQGLRRGSADTTSSGGWRSHRSYASSGSVHDDDVASVRSDHSNRSDGDIPFLGRPQQPTPVNQYQQQQYQYQHHQQYQSPYPYQQPPLMPSHQLVPMNSDTLAKHSSFKAHQYYVGSPTASDARTLSSIDSSDRGTYHSTTSSGKAATTQEFWELYSQMQKLQIAAEKTYELAKDNSRKLQHPEP